MRYSSWQLGLVSLTAAFACLLGTRAAAQVEIVSSAIVEFSATPGGDTLTVVSNEVRLFLTSTMEFELIGESGMDLSPGDVAYFLHTLTNTAAYPQTFKITYAQSPGDDFSLEGFSLIIDQNNNGLIDPGEPEIVSGGTVALASGESVGLILHGRVPLSAAPGHICRPIISAQETFSSGTLARANRVNALLVLSAMNDLAVEKTVSRPFVEVGETVDYLVTITNVSGGDLATVVFEDRMPVGFIFQPGSFRINGSIAADPASSPSRVFTYDLGALAAGAAISVGYRARVGVNALHGDGVNRARAEGPGGVASNIALARVRVEEGVFSSRALVIGRVFVDKNGNRVFDEGDLGVPGVRLYFLDGTHVTTDIDGKYSVYGLAPRTNVAKVDAITLPRGSRVVVSSQRQAGDAGTRFVDLKRYEMHKADFIIESDSPELEAEIARRREALAPREREGFGRQLEERLTTDGVPVAPSDIRAQPAAGVITAEGPRVVTASPVLAPELARPVPESVFQSEAGADVPLVEEKREALPLPTDNTLGFADLTDGQVLLRAQTDVRVKGPRGGVFALRVNGESVSDKKVGMQEVDPVRNIEVWTFVGVDLNPGRNSLGVGLTDPFGNVRGVREVVVVAPGPLAQIRLTPPARELVADGAAANSFVVELVDADGVPVGGRTPVTLAAEAGVWQVVDRDLSEPGVQTFIEGGRAVFDLVSPGEPGTVALQVSTGLLHAEAEVVFLPDLRPLIAVGLIEGTLNLGGRGRGALMPVGVRDAFEEELRSLSASADAGRLGAGARAAFFLKGKIKGDYLLTAAYDSEKSDERLFRDIQPDEFYPVYGDSSVRGFDAQSTGRLYVRIDKNRSYLLLGDFTTRTTTSAGEEDLHALGSYQRSLNGVRQHYENDRVRANAWVSQDSTRQVIDEVRADGTSGPYFGNLGNALVNSERVEILIRDRDQPSRVIETTPLARFFDYDFEPFSGRLLLRAPVPSLDPNLNPVSIRITYEVESGGESFWVYGADGRVRVTERLSVGGTFARDEDPLDNYQLVSGAASYRFAERTTLTAEVARSESDLDGNGMAGRVDFKHRDELTDVHAYVGRTDEGFRNPGAMFLPGRVEGGVKATRKLGPTTTFVGQGLYTEDLATGGRRNGVRADIEQAFGPYRVAVGARRVDESTAPASPSMVGYTSLRT